MGPRHLTESGNNCSETREGEEVEKQKEEEEMYLFIFHSIKHGT
jgi:hypothetical protein